MSQVLLSKHLLVPSPSTQFIHSSPASCLPVCLSTCLLSQKLLSKHSLGSVLFNTIHSFFTCLLPSCLPVSTCLMSQELLSKHLLGSVPFNTIHSLFTCLPYSCLPVFLFSCLPVCLPSCLPIYLPYESGTAFKTSTGFRPLQHNSVTLHLPAAFLSACLPAL